MFKKASTVWKFEVRKAIYAFVGFDSEENVFQHAVNRSRCLEKDSLLRGSK